MKIFRRLLPGDIGVAETKSDFGYLLKAEQEYFETASAQRRLEATTVRACARRVLEEFGFPEHVLVPGEHGEPSWPDSLVGSMSHCRGFRAAAVGLRDRYEAIGIDVELALPLSAAALEAIRNPEERPSRHHPLWSKILFSAKEATYKALSASDAENLDLSDLVISLKQSGSFIASIPSRWRSPACNMIGRWIVHDGIVATSAIHLAGAALDRSQKLQQQRPTFRDRVS